MDFTITIPCRNRVHVANEAIKGFLDSCDYPILIIDDNSDAPTASYINHERVKIIFNNTKSGYVQLINQCILESETEYVIVASDKIVVRKLDIKRIEDKLIEGFACVCTQLMHIYGFSKDLINRIGLFDSGFVKSGFEDTDWMNRLFINDLALYFSRETELQNISSDWSVNHENKKYYDSKWIEDFDNSKLTQVCDEQNSESVKIFRNMYTEKVYLPWSKSQLKVDGIINYYNNRVATKRFKTKSVTSFMYHDVRDCTNERYKRRYDLKSFLTIKQFDEQIRYIVDRYKVISAQQLHDMLDGGGIDDEYAVLTFDDGLLDHYTNVLPIIKYYKVPGIFFIAGGPIVENQIVSSHKIQFILSCVGDEKYIVKRIFDKLEVSIDESDYIWEKFSVARFKNNWWTKEMIFITNFLRYSVEKKYTIVDELFNEFVTLDQETFNKEFYLNELHVKEFIKSGMEIGGHGFTSENLLSLDEESRKEDLTKSMDFIKSFLNNNLITFSYPNGAYDDSVIKVLQSNGCKLAYTTEEKVIGQHDVVNYLQIPRFNGLERVYL